MEGARYRQDIPNKGLAAKFVQSKGLWEGAKVGIGVFARECVVLFGRSPVVNVLPLSRSRLQVRSDLSASDTTLGGVWPFFNCTRGVKGVGPRLAG